ncbi:rCG49720 [Rattus norvegicus]|uniref:RCG49720 n=1 Tax=Rattus norvegicus TaxID=10116 RepID=A6K2H0_RAT|nr:rCG49720 [Rattus norvegicus]
MVLFSRKLHSILFSAVFTHNFSQIAETGDSGEESWDKRHFRTPRKLNLSS